MKLLNVFTWWATFTIVWWAMTFALVFSSSTNDGVGYISISSRAINTYLAQTYGLGAYVILSILLITVRAFQVYKKKQ